MVTQLRPELATVLLNVADHGVTVSLLSSADLTRPIVIDAAKASEMMRQYSWLLERIGDDRITLTSAGRLPPAVVEETVSALDLNPYGFGKANREVHTPVGYLRESTQRLGLARRSKGSLILTPAGRRLRSDPVALWWHVAQHLPEEKREFAQHAGFLVLLAVASGLPAGDSLGLGKLVADGLADIGWRDPQTGERPSDIDAFQAGWETWTTLRRTGAIPERAPREGDKPAPAPGPSGRAFARAALTVSET